MVVGVSGCGGVSVSGVFRGFDVLKLGVLSRGF